MDAQNIFGKRKLVETARFFFLIQDYYDYVPSQILNFSFLDFLENEDLENTKVTSVALASDPEPHSSPYRYGQQLLGS